MPDVTEIRNPLDVSKLEQFLTKLPKNIILGKSKVEFVGPLKVLQFTFGQSNPTYLVGDAKGNQYVLRRKPSANAKLVLKSSHAIEREFHILNAIAHCNEHVSEQRKVPVPDVYILCEDESVLGYVFYVMEYVDGRLIKRADMPEISTSDQEKYWGAIMQTVSSIHSLDYSVLTQHLPATHFPNVRQKGNSQLLYFDRQIKTLKRMEELQAKTVDGIPHFKAITEYIENHAPSDPSPQMLIHGDCKIDNLLFHPTEPKVIAVLDWELCTVGHPIFDLANMLQPYEFPVAFNSFVYRSSDTEIGCENASSAKQVKLLLEMYMKSLGRSWEPSNPSNNPLDKWNVGVIFGILRLCVISQGIAMRVKKGAASSASAALYGSIYKDLSDLAFSRISDISKL